MPPNELQLHFFEHLKTIVPAHLSLADELSELLGLSYDSVYRRLRGEKSIDINELRKICEAYHISLDQVLQLQNDAVVFRAPGINSNGRPFEEYLRGMLQTVRHFNSFEKREMRYFCKDMTFFHYYLFPEIAAFKTFFWMKTILNTPSFADVKFSLEKFPFTDSLQLGREIVAEYNKIPSIELWNYESVNSTMGQLQYYRDTDLFSTADDLARVVDSLNLLLEHMRQQAEKGFKFAPGHADTGQRASLQFYVNEVVLGNNTILVELDGVRHSFITYNVLSYLESRDPRFNEKSFSNFNTIVSRSNLISGTGERDRSKFFKALRQKVATLNTSTLG